MTIFQAMRKRTGILEIIILLLAYGSTATALKCTSTKAGVYYAGNTGPRIDDIKSYQDCQTLCENDKVCYGWQYQSSSNSCWLQTSIDIEYTDPTYVAGYCIGPAAKATPCTEVLPNMYYNGNSGSAIHNVVSSDACMKKCDADPTCLGWSYRHTDNTCWTQTTVYGKTTDQQYMGGSCIKPQTPYPSISIDTYRQQALEKHNSYRSKHGSSQLTLDSELNDIAQQYADHLAATKTFAHSGNKFHGNYMGENIYMVNGLSQPMYAKGSDPVTDWYSEIAAYDWSNPGFGANTGHFTQLVWKNTTNFGMGRGLSKDNSTLYIVANYYPGGNMGGQFPDNVPRSS